jgi:hypothetical protein
MKTELRLARHSMLPDHNLIEVWYEGKFIATVTGADVPGVRIISKHPASGVLNHLITEVRLDTTKVLA